MIDHAVNYELRIEWEHLQAERAQRITRLIEERCMTPEAAAIVVNAAMFGIGCTEGTVRAKIQKQMEETK